MVGAVRRALTRRLQENGTAPGAHQITHGGVAIVRGGSIDRVLG